ncbi:proline and serine-rich protein 3 isoform X2 [Trichosurus vulpecula]|uniref:proline and serine-rich protein 3 isoform X2 n=1 Tax=Trichosurus vulpecula TaxID=9337 RepID=UPI00186AD1D0|nr:proline and serine-rich protein 3 isoform X2 [Trichosurus vulpecula]
MLQSLGLPRARVDWGREGRPGCSNESRIPRKGRILAPRGNRARPIPSESRATQRWRPSPCQSLPLSTVLERRVANRAAPAFLRSPAPQEKKNPWTKAVSAQAHLSATARGGWSGTGQLLFPPQCFRRGGRVWEGCCLATDSAGPEAGEGRGMVRGGGGDGNGDRGSGCGMDNSLAVFSFRGSSCKATPPRRRSYYQPSPERELGRGGGARTAVLSPLRPRQLSPPASPPAPTSPNFDESWPSTSLSSPSDPPEEQTDQLGDSVLARYMARFRQAQPTSRQERQAAGPTAADFWWLQPPALGFPGPSADEEAGGGSLNPAIPTQTGPQGAGASRMEACVSGTHEGHISPLEASDTSVLDLETLSLQDRAARLLLQSEISSSSSNEVTSIPVSSDGLPSPSPPFTSDPGAGPHPREPAPLTRTQVPVPSVAHPENDILSQWRLRRKMELAQEVTVTHGQPKPHQIYAPGPTVANQLNSLVPPTNPQPSPPVPLCGPQQVSPVPLCGPHQVPPVLLCGLQQVPPVLLYGPQQSPAVLCQHELNSTVSLNIPQLNSPVPLSLPQPCPPNSPYTPHPSPVVPLCTPQPNPPALRCASQPSPQPAVPNSLATCQSSFHLHSASPETGCKRFQSGAFLPSSRGPSEPKRQDHKPKKAWNPDSKSRTPRPGPMLRGAMEQVVAARLFPGPSEDFPSPCEAPPSVETPLPPAETPPSRELLALASGLLEAAEDSDGTDFEEDALLQVLRARRSELRSCLRKVDKCLSKTMDPKNLRPNFQPAGTLGSPNEISSRHRIEE